MPCDVELTIERWDDDTAGLGALAGGITVRVPFTLPGERVRARVWRQRGDQAAADLLAVLSPSPERTLPGCLLFGTCGGCQLQHVRAETQRTWKTAVVRRHLAGVLGVGVEVAEAIPSPRAYGYRSKITPHYEPARDGTPLAIGFLRAGRRHAIVDVPRCAIATDGINDALPALRATATEAARGRRRGASLLLREGLAGVTSDPDAEVSERVGEVTLAFAAREFFQNNPFLLPELVSYVVDQAAAFGAAVLVDAYSGSGLFALSAARRFARVFGVEVSPAAVASARANAERNGLTNVEFLAAPAARIFSGLSVPGDDAVVIVDPPRKGADESFLAQLIAFRPRAIIYVSCNPETAARDLARLVAAGPFAVDKVQPFDMFPQTRHVECVVVLRRSSLPARPLG